MPKRLAIAGLVVLASLSFPALASSGASVERPIAGSCDTTPVIVVEPGRPGFYTFTLAGTCHIAHLGLTHVEASGLIHPPVWFGEGSYTAANGDALSFGFAGETQAAIVGLDFVLTGQQTIVGLSGRFAGATGLVDVNGTATSEGSGLPGTGTLSIAGSISY